MPRIGRGSQREIAPRAVSVDRLTPATENYLLSLYVLGEEGTRATPGQLAEHLKTLPAGEGLGTSFPTVLSMLRRMAREDLVELSPSKEVKLTSRGLVLAEGMVRRHRLAERMVVDLLGLELHKAHVEAHRLEHAISPDIEVRIRERLGNPTTCPFGRPIPGSGYVPPRGERLTLDQVRPGVSYCVDRVPEEDSELLRFLVEHAVLPEEEVTVVEASPHRGVVTIRTRMGEGALGYAVASRIWLHPCE
ncbi:MAG: metal-dependent transcriptional regulator [Chloroflexi bacterium]|nr:metal-dependent transcriptional regulator [Chloroflexota bacterium]